MRHIRDYRIKVFRYKIANELNYDYSLTERLEGNYRRRKAKKYPGRRIRVATGAFQAGHVVIVYQGEVVESLDDPKSQWLMEGTSKMKARPLLPPDGAEIPYTEQREIDRLVDDFIDSLDSKFR